MLHHGDKAKMGYVNNSNGSKIPLLKIQICQE